MFRIPILVSILTIGAVFICSGLSAAITVVILGLLEITFSFDNAIVNAKILKRMNMHWQKLFLTVGIVIAVFGMRLIFPLVIVALSAHINPLSALNLAIAHPSQYATHIKSAHPAIAAFGGTFLVMLFLDWLFEEREIQWLGPIERTLCRLGKIENMSVIVMTILLVLSASLFGHSGMVLMSGLLGLAVYLLVNSIDGFFNEDSVATIAKAGLATFLYLEVLDASFSFDGVVGAFAVTNNIFLIAIGLGIGAMFIRGLTVYLTNSGKLAEYRYLEHGAHWAIGILASLLLITIKYEISDIITGMIGITCITAALISSIIANKGEK
jgi:hypothetical protein